MQNDIIPSVELSAIATDAATSIAPDATSEATAPQAEPAKPEAKAAPKRNVRLAKAKPDAKAEPAKPATQAIAERVRAGTTSQRAEAEKQAAAKAAKQSKAKPDAKQAEPASEPAPTPNRGLARDASGIVRQATFFDQTSDRDLAYLRFFGSVCRANGHRATLAQIHDAGIARAGEKTNKRYNPHYAGSGKATDIGAINRQIKAGNFTFTDGGNTIVATERAQKLAAYNGTK